MDFIKNILVSGIGSLLMAVPGYQRIAYKVCVVGSDRTDFFSRLISASFWKKYYQLPLGERMDIQLLLMGGDAGVSWADYYQEHKIFERGENMIGVLDFRDFCPVYDRVSRFLKEVKEDCSIIQVGASSGKEIAYFAKKYPQHEYYYTDIFDSVVEYAQSFHNSENIKFFVASAEEIHLIASVVSTKNILVFSISSLQYVYPENLCKMFARLSKISNKEITLIINEPGNDLKVDPLLMEGSSPRGKFSYTHNYSHYAKNNGFQALEWKKISPYTPQEKYFPNHQGTVHLHGIFDNSAP